MNKGEIDLSTNFNFNKSSELLESDVSSDPFEQFKIWFNEAAKIDPSEVHANAMSLATCSKEGRPSVRTVLLKDFDKRGFVFFTNYSSRKGNELRENPFASLLFYWKDLERQIRIEGATELLTKHESEKYFHNRPFDSQVAALASNQSSVIESREELMSIFDELKEKYEGDIVPLPEYWGGYRLIPEKLEFWQGRQNRLHDRILYSRDNGKWKIERLAP